jgi:hypothetical protein
LVSQLVECFVVQFAMEYFARAAVNILSPGEMLRVDEALQVA